MGKEKSIVMTMFVALILNSQVIIQMEKETEKELKILRKVKLNLQEIFLKEVITMEKDMIQTGKKFLK